MTSIIYIRKGILVDVYGDMDYYLVDYDNIGIGECPLCCGALNREYCNDCGLDWATDPDSEAILLAADRYYN